MSMRTPWGAAYSANFAECRSYLLQRLPLMSHVGYSVAEYSHIANAQKRRQIDIILGFCYVLIHIGTVEETGGTQTSDAQPSFGQISLGTGDVVRQERLCLRQVHHILNAGISRPSYPIAAQLPQSVSQDQSGHPRVEKQSFMHEYLPRMILLLPSTCTIRMRCDRISSGVNNAYDMMIPKSPT